MRKIMVLQHMAHEILGTLNPLLKGKGFRIRYVNYERHPELMPSLERYNGLIVLGGPMSANETADYPHLKGEMKLVEEALTKEIPVLGICLGAQIVAKVLGASVRKSRHKELGWYDVSLTKDGKADPLFGHFEETERIFQWHEESFEIPKGCKHLASSELCEGQAFSYGDRVYGMQFHLEVDKAMIHRRLKVTHGKFDAPQIEAETALCIDRSLELSHKTFTEFIKLFRLKEKSVGMGSGHGKSRI